MPAGCERQHSSARANGVPRAGHRAKGRETATDQDGNPALRRPRVFPDQVNVGGEPRVGHRQRLSRAAAADADPAHPDDGRLHVRGLHFADGSPDLSVRSPGLDAAASRMFRWAATSWTRCSVVVTPHFTPARANHRGWHTSRVAPPPDCQLSMFDPIAFFLACQRGISGA